MDNKKPPYKALDVAQVVIDYYIANNKLITNLVLQKILFFIQWYYLRYKDVPCFEDEIEAWQYGPVVPSVYQKYKVVQSMLDIVDINFRYDTSSIKLGSIDCIKSDDKVNINNNILQILEKYNNKPWELVEMSHKDNGCWYKVWHSNDDNRIISHDSIKNDNTITIFN